MDSHKIVGTLVPIFSLQSTMLSIADQGTFAAGFEFLDWLHRTKQKAWQMLPLSETQLEKGSGAKRIPSPYKGYGIGFAERYLPSFFAKLAPTPQQRKAFITQHAYWIEDYVLFRALSEKFGSDDWRTWDDSLRNRELESLKLWTARLADRIEFFFITQWQLHEAYHALHHKAKSLGISLIGDLPFYIAVNSPLVWAHQDVFDLGDDRSMPFVSGIPNTTHTHFGRQIWGHPLYNWKEKEKVLAFWKMRLLYRSEVYDLLRFDHAKAFFSYGAMDTHDEKNDMYIDGPGQAFVKALLDFSQQQNLKIFVEDSGDRIDDLRDFMQKESIEGIKTFWFAYNKKADVLNKKYADLAQYPQNCVAYTSTHDTETLMEFVHSLTNIQKQMLAADAVVEFTQDEKEFAGRLRRAVIDSPARTVIIPIQDWLLTMDRINIPGTEKEIGDTNWHYQLQIPVESLPQVSF